MEAADVAFTPNSGGADSRSIDRDLVGLQKLDDFLQRRLAAILLAVGDDVDDAEPFLGPGGEFLGRGENGIVEGMDFLGNGNERSVACRAPRLQIWIDAVAIFADVAPGKGTAVDGHLLIGAGSLGQCQHRGYASALGSGKSGPLLGAIVVRKDRHLVVGLSLIHI